MTSFERLCIAALIIGAILVLAGIIGVVNQVSVTSM